MTFNVLGYAEFSDELKPSDAESIRAAIGTPLGFNTLDKEHLDFPESYIPSDSAFSFIVYSSPSGGSAGYLVDYTDYFPGGNLSLPLKGIDRLKLLDDLVQGLFNKCFATQVVLLVIDSDPIEEQKDIYLDEFFEVLVGDSEKCAPPDNLYIITRRDT